jgi:hypothetical protein
VADTVAVSREVRAAAIWPARAVPGLYAWGLTVLAPAISVGGWQSQLLAGLAAGALTLGAATSVRRPVIGRALGIPIFLLCCGLCWGMLPSVPRAGGPTWFIGMLGALGWVMFPLGWGDPPRVSVGGAPDAVKGLPTLRARVRPSAWGGICLVAALLAALIGSALAWADTRQPQSMVAHVACALGGIGLMSIAARIALKRHGHGSGRLSGAGLAASGLGVLASALLVVVGAWYALQHRDRTSIGVWLLAAVLGSLSSHLVRRSPSRPGAGPRSGP